MGTANTYEVKFGLGKGYSLNRSADGTYRFEHTCDRTSTDRGVHRVAVLLSPENHKIRGFPPTVIPSILCSDCGTHGWITNGKWTDA